MESIYIILIMFGIVGCGAFWYICVSLKRMAVRLEDHQRDLAIHEKTIERCMDMMSSLSAKVQELDKEMGTAREAIENWSEAGKIARKSEEDFNEGLNNILNFQPNVKHKGDEN